MLESRTHSVHSLNKPNKKSMPIYAPYQPSPPMKEAVKDIYTAPMWRKKQRRIPAKQSPKIRNKEN